MDGLHNAAWHQCGSNDSSQWVKVTVCTWDAADRKEEQHIYHLADFFVLFIYFFPQFVSHATQIIKRSCAARQRLLRGRIRMHLQIRYAFVIMICFFFFYTTPLQTSAEKLHMSLRSQSPPGRGSLMGSNAPYGAAACFRIRLKLDVPQS